MDDEVFAAVQRHRAKFGEFDANAVTVDFGAPGVKQRFLDAIDQAIATDTPVTDEALGISFPEDALI